MDSNFKDSLLIPEDMQYLTEVITKMMASPRNYNVLNDGIDIIKRIFRRSNYRLKFSITILDSSMDEEFDGISIYPELNICETIVDKIIDNSSNRMDDIATVRDIWSSNENWHMDIDSKLLFNYSKTFTPEEVVSLILYEIEKLILYYDVIDLMYRTVRTFIIKLPYTIGTIAQSVTCRRFFILPFMQACRYNNYLLELPEESKLNNIYNQDSYYSAINKIITWYGNSDVSRNSSELYGEVETILAWIFKSINDLTLGMSLLKKTVKEHILSEKSLYIKDFLISVYNAFANYDSNVSINESYVPMDFKDSDKTKEFVNKIIKITKESFFNSAAKRISQEDIDVIRIQASNMESQDDKIYLLGKVYELLSIVDSAITISEDPTQVGRVKQSIHSLEKQRNDLIKLREYIISTPVAVKRYGLYIKYPENYIG